MRMRCVLVGALAISALGASRPGAAQTFEVVQKFSTGPGAPTGHLVEAPNGYFYGVTSGGGEFNAGTVFRMDGAGAIEILHEFRPQGTEPYGPSGGLVLLG